MGILQAAAAKSFHIAYTREVEQELIKNGLTPITSLSLAEHNLLDGEKSFIQLDDVDGHKRILLISGQPSEDKQRPALAINISGYGVDFRGGHVHPSSVGESNALSFTPEKLTDDETYFSRGRAKVYSWADSEQEISVKIVQWLLEKAEAAVVDNLLPPEERLQKLGVLAPTLNP